jgi:hypothetical protein
MKTKLTMGMICIAGILTFGTSALADRDPPAEVAPVEFDGVLYTVEHWGVEAGYEQNGGIVEAYDMTFGEFLWSVLIYKIEYDPNLESDVQDVFITELTIEDGDLVVTNEQGGEYTIDLVDHSVETLEGESVYANTPEDPPIEEDDVESSTNDSSGCSMVRSGPGLLHGFATVLTLLF